LESTIGRSGGEEGVKKVRGGGGVKVVVRKGRKAEGKRREIGDVRGREKPGDLWERVGGGKFSSVGE